MEITNYKYFSARIRKGYPFNIPFTGRLKAVLRVNPRSGDYKLEIKNPSAEKLNINKQNLQIYNNPQNKKIVIALKDFHLCDEFFHFCSKIAIKIQNQNVKSIKEEILRAIDNFDSLLKSSKDFSETKIIGLWGELYILFVNLTKNNQKRIVNSWYGPFDEEHDFSSKKIDFEIKTTSKDKRIHTISSLTQLEEKPGRHLFLLSLQITPGIGTNSYTVFSLILKIKNLLQNNTAAFDDFNDKISLFKGLLALDQSKARSYILRSEIRKIKINKAFPRITNKTIDLSKNSKSRIIDCEYSINCEDLGQVINGKIKL